eukprot:913445-Prymnesium_polylepis.1
MWRRRPGGCTILPAPHHRRTDMHPSRCLSGARMARTAHWPSVPSSRRARRVPCRVCARGGSAVE